MSYEISFLDDECGIVVEYFGDLSSDEFRKGTEERFLDDERTKKLKYVIADYTKTSVVNLSVEDIKYVANFGVIASKLNKNVVSIAVVPSDLKFGLARMWQTYSYETDWQIFTVRSREEAEAKIKEILALEFKFNS